MVMLINFQNNLPRDGVDFLSFEISKSGFLKNSYFFLIMCLPAHPWDTDNAQELSGGNLCPMSCKGLG